MAFGTIIASVCRIAIEVRVSEAQPAYLVRQTLADIGKH